MNERWKCFIIFCYLCLIIFVFENVLVYRNNLTNITEPSTTYSHAFIKQGMFNFSNQLSRLSHSERRLIILNADTHIQIDGVTDFLQHHKQVVYFDSLTTDIERVDRRHALDLCFSIFECSLILFCGLCQRQVAFW